MSKIGRRRDDWPGCPRRWLQGSGRPAQVEKLRGEGESGLSIWKLAPGAPRVCGKRGRLTHPREEMGGPLFSPPSAQTPGASPRPCWNLLLKSVLQTFPAVWGMQKLTHPSIQSDTKIFFLSIYSAPDTVPGAGFCRREQVSASGLLELTGKQACAKQPVR